MARKRYDDGPENHERWLISYADFITLLFAFFVVMYAISSVNEGKYQVFSNALVSAFGGGPPPPTNTMQQSMPIPNIAAKRRADAIKREKESLTKLAQGLKSTLAPLVKEGRLRVTQNSRGVTVEINASELFDPGDATLTADAQEVLASLAEILKADPHAVQVEGHTDTTPISNTKFPSNWELSAVRAASVVRLFIDSGVPAARLSVVGFGANIPVASNDDPVGRARNRRVAVTILSALPDAVAPDVTAPLPR
jgi:chemotaxis protein MotB